MKCIHALLTLALVSLVSASTFLLTVKNDPTSGKPYVEYEGEKHFLTNETSGKETFFLKGDCLVKIDLSLNTDSHVRDGSVVCKETFDKTGVLDWEAFVKEQMAALNSTSTTEMTKSLNTKLRKTTDFVKFTTPSRLTKGISYVLGHSGKCGHAAERASANVLKNPETGEEYVEYEGEIFYLTDGPWDVETSFIKNDCVVRMQLSKSILGPQRKGSALCKADYEKFGATDWKEFSEEQL
ncbi:hypothetical protein ACTXT7_012036 [Hymenolepis weldensis]